MDPRRFDRFTRELSAGASRRRVLRGVAAGAAGLAAAALGRTTATAAPSPCNAAASLAFPPGPGRAAFQQVCKQCDADLDRVCRTALASFVCCPVGEACCVDCSSGTPQCGTPDPIDPFCCEGTIPV